ncbi:unnamed protein product [Didymodactylos carnosus]|uniref:Large ribosomal subunit protein uL24 C-terminal domain-containing protein n=1 Tax=Didymodactylos carnosus TaxID=1234261 RepID=A0A8S2GLC0_9BILA|nr:unnamed protein product [Didymodactylos carnosus]CAF3532442.1 unnamed protein product [Didymodactylos carnosus]
MPKANLLTIEGVNIIKKHTKPNKENDKGGIVEQEAPLMNHKVALLDPKKKGAITKVKFKTNKDGKKVRVTAKSQTELTGAKK